MTPFGSSAATSSKKITSPEYLIETILPRHEIHMLGGPSGAGKTKWLLETLTAWRGGQPVLDYMSHPVPWVYVAADRTIDGLKRNLESMKIAMESVPYIAAWDRGMSLCQILTEAKEMGSKLLVLESMGSFVDPPGRSNQVKAFMQALSRSIKQDDMTIIGVMESPKMKPNDVYKNPRQRISGVASWGHFAETIFLIEPNLECEGNERFLHVCPRAAATLKFHAEIGPRFVIKGICEEKSPEEKFFRGKNQ